MANRIGVWVGHRVGLNAVEKSSYRQSYRDSFEWYIRLLIFSTSAGKYMCHLLQHHVRLSRQTAVLSLHSISQLISVAGKWSALREEVSEFLHSSNFKELNRIGLANSSEKFDVNLKGQRKKT